MAILSQKPRDKGAKRTPLRLDPALSYLWISAASAILIEVFPRTRNRPTRTSSRPIRNRLGFSSVRRHDEKKANFFANAHAPGVNSTVSAQICTLRIRIFLMFGCEMAGDFCEMNTPRRSYGAFSPQCPSHLHSRLPCRDHSEGRFNGGPAQFVSIPLLSFSALRHPIPIPILSAKPAL